MHGALSVFKLSNYQIKGPSDSNVKSIQMGSSTMSAASLLDVTVSAIDTTKTILLFSIRVQNSDPDRSLISGQLLNSTTIRFQRYETAPDATIEWQLLEFKNVKSLQRGATTMTSGVAVVTQNITAVDLAKSFMYASWRTTTAFTTIDHRIFHTYKFNSTSQLGFETMVSGYEKVFEWQAVEFQ